MQLPKGRPLCSNLVKGMGVQGFASLGDGSGPLEFPGLREHPMPGRFCVNMRRALPACSAALRSTFCAPSTQIRLRTTRVL